MSEMIKPMAEWSAAIIEAFGIIVITSVALYTLVMAAIGVLRRETTESVYHQLRLRLGRGILLGLEFLVAADIIDTVAVDLSFRSVGVLAAVVLVRTFLSFVLEVELTGRWPWQEKK